MCEPGVITLYDSRVVEHLVPLTAHVEPLLNAESGSERLS